MPRVPESSGRVLNCPHFLQKPAKRPLGRKAHGSIRIQEGEPPYASPRLPGVFANDVHPPPAETPLLASTKGVAQLTKNEEDGPRQRSPSPGHVPRTPAAQAHAGHGLPEQRRQVAGNCRRF